MRHALLIASFVLGITFQASAQNAPSAYAAFAPTSMFVIAEHGTDAKIKRGVSLIDPVNQVNCASAAGCTLMATSQMEIDASGAYVIICTLVDGSAIGPQCTKLNLANRGAHTFSVGSYNTDGPEANMQIAINLSPGTHTVQTELHAKSEFSQPPLTGRADWTINYTLYGH